MNISNCIQKNLMNIQCGIFITGKDRQAEIQNPRMKIVTKQGKVMDTKNGYWIWIKSLMVIIMDLYNVLIVKKILQEISLMYHYSQLMEKQKNVIGSEK